MRSITNSKYNDSSGPIYKNLSILPLTGLYKLETVKCMYLNQRNELPLPLQIVNMTEYWGVGILGLQVSEYWGVGIVGSLETKFNGLNI